MAERIFLPPASAAGGRITPASFPFYTTGEDNLRITSYNSIFGTALKINARLVDESGKVKPDTWDHKPNIDRSAKTDDLPLSGCTLLNLTVFATGTSPAMGQCFVVVQLIRGLGPAAMVVGTIVQGYVTKAQALGFPGSPLQSSLDSGGYYRTIVGATPPAGGEMSETVPTGARWILETVALVLLTSATVANRTPILIFNDIGSIVALSGSPTSVGASSSARFVWALGLPLATAVGVASGVAGLPTDSPLLAGASWSTITNNIQPGDSYQAPIYRVREWIEP